MPREDQLLGLRVGVGLQRRVVADQLAQRVGQLGLVGRLVRDDRLRDHRLREADRLQRDRRVLGRRACCPCTSASGRRRRRSRPARPLPAPAACRPSCGRCGRCARSCRSVVFSTSRPGLQLAGVDAQEHQVAGRLGDGLERQAAERLLRVRLALRPSPSSSGTMPSTGGRSSGRRQVVHDRVEQQLDAVEVLRRAAIDPA